MGKGGGTLTDAERAMRCLVVSRCRVGRAGADVGFGGRAGSAPPDTRGKVRADANGDENDGRIRGILVFDPPLGNLNGLGMMSEFISRV